MNEKEIRKLSKAELIELLLYQSKQIDELKEKLDILEKEHVKKSDLLTAQDVWKITSQCLSDKVGELSAQIDISNKKNEEMLNGIPVQEDIKRIVTECLTDARVNEQTEQTVQTVMNAINERLTDQSDKLLREIDRKNTELLLELSRQDGKRRGLFGR